MNIAGGCECNLRIETSALTYTHTYIQPNIHRGEGKQENDCCSCRSYVIPQSD